VEDIMRSDVTADRDWHLFCPFSFGK